MFKIEANANEAVASTRREIVKDFVGFGLLPLRKTIHVSIHFCRFAGNSKTIVSPFFYLSLPSSSSQTLLKAVGAWAEAVVHDAYGPKFACLNASSADAPGL